MPGWLTAQETNAAGDYARTALTGPRLGGNELAHLVTHR